MIGQWRILALTAALAAVPGLPAGPCSAEAQGIAAARPALRAPTADSVSLASVYALARERNPMLRAASALADATAARESSEGLPPDPVLQVGVMNFSLPGFGLDMPTTMAPSVQAMQMLPFPGKLGLRERIAEQSTSMARSGAEEKWWEVRSMAATAFFGVYEVDHKLSVMRETLSLLEDFKQVAQAMYAAGTGRQSDVLRANVEVARMDAEIHRMVAMRKVAAAKLNAVLDRPADTPVAAAVLPPLPDTTPGQETLRAWAEQTRPLLQRSKTGVEQAEKGEDLARKQIWPDFTVGVQYGQRNAAGGTARMGSAMIGFSIPLFAKSRQLRLRDEAAAMQDMAEARLASDRAQVDARIGELLAELERARTLVALYRAEILPEADANVESAFSSYRVGAVDFMTLVDAQMTANSYKQELYALLADYGRAVASLETTVGRELPAATNLMAEAR